jgi:FMN phosphatase YigB (HAD superfamily)
MVVPDEGAMTSVNGTDGLAAWLPQIQVVVFDLDGTLYEGTDFLDPYLAFLAEDTPGVSAAMLREEIERVVNGEHVLRLGAFYHPDRRIIVEPEFVQREVMVKRALGWDGTVLPPEGEDGAQAIPFDTEMVYVGDYWQAALAVAVQNGVSVDERRKAFARTREVMNAEDYDLGVPKQLFELLDAFSHCRHRVLVTNTPEELGRACVDKLGVEGYFDEIVFGARKPQGLFDLLQSLAARFGIDLDEILCVGDNFWNDIVPAVRLGARTILVDAFDAGEDAGSDSRALTVDHVAGMVVPHVAASSKAPARDRHSTSER